MPTTPAKRQSIRQIPLSGPDADAARDYTLGTVEGSYSWQRLRPLILLWLSLELALLLLAWAGRQAGLSLPVMPANGMLLLVSGVPLALGLLWQASRQPARSPAMDEARLMALTARIRPHFLYNSLNAVLGTIRSDPRAAETALEEMSDLFRALMQDPRHLVPLSEEIALCRKYLALEKLRLGERLQVHWDIAACPPDAAMPPLILQPLLGNAVYHGVEPLENPGPIVLRLHSAGDLLVIELSNPYAENLGQTQGNRMALANIRERLALFYGPAAYLQAAPEGPVGQEERYVLRIVLPIQGDKSLRKAHG